MYPCKDCLVVGTCTSSCESKQAIGNIRDIILTEYKCPYCGNEHITCFGKVQVFECSMCHVLFFISYYNGHLSIRSHSWREEGLRIQYKDKLKDMTFKDLVRKRIMSKWRRRYTKEKEWLKYKLEQLDINAEENINRLYTEFPKGGRGK